MREWVDYDDGLDYEDLRIEREKLRHRQVKAAVTGTSPVWIFAFSCLLSIVVFAAVTYFTAHKGMDVNLDKVDTTDITLAGSNDLGGISSGEKVAFDYTVTNTSSQPAYIFLRIDANQYTDAISGQSKELYELTDLDNTDGSWTKIDSGQPGQIVYAYGGSGTMSPVQINETVVLNAQFHCLADAESYKDLSESDMDISVHGCLVFGVGGNVSESPSALYQIYKDNATE